MTEPTPPPASSEPVAPDDAARGCVLHAAALAMLDATAALRAAQQLAVAGAAAATARSGDAAAAAAEFTQLTDAGFRHFTRLGDAVVAMLQKLDRDDDRAPAQSLSKSR